MKNCSDCGVAPGELHHHGCDVERCPLCKGQALSCFCVYKVNDSENYDEDPTDEMWAKLDAEVAKVGGYQPWTGEFPGMKECRELNFWCKMVPGTGWVTCDKDDPEATEDLNRLAIYIQQ